MSHLDTIILTLKTRMETDLVETLRNFNFEDYRTSQEIEFLKNDLRNREAALLAIKAKGFNEFAAPTGSEKEILSQNQVDSLRTEIMNRLKYQNPKLEEDF